MDLNMKIYTKTGDDGSTGLFGGQRVSKSNLRVDVYGTIDELNSVIGIVIANDPREKMIETLESICSKLFVAGSDIATPIENAKVSIQRISEDDITSLEKLIDEYTSVLPELKHFILPGGSKTSAYLHLARTVCRRAERLAVELSLSENIGDFIIRYLNRLSDFLFTASRYANYLEGVEDKQWIQNK